MTAPTGPTGPTGSATLPVDMNVTGGVDGITANLSDIMTLQTVVSDAQNTVNDVDKKLGSFALWVGLASGDTVEPARTRVILDSLAQFRTGLTARASELDALHDKFSITKVVYNNTESDVFDAVKGFAERIGAASWDLASFNFGGFKDDLEKDLFDLAPGAIDFTSSLLGGWFESLFTGQVSDGHPVLHDLGVDSTQTAPPRTLDDLISELAVRDKTAPGEISVTMLTSPDGQRRAIVDIPGTKSWNPLPGSDVTSVGTDVRALTGQHTSYEDGVLAALRAAGVTPDTDVMLVGHSEGGIIAVNAARHASREFHFTHVITLGSPVGKLVGEVPNSVQVLSLENSADIMPEFDGAANPDSPNITTVRMDDQHDSFGENHSITDSYLPIAEAAEHSGNGSIDAFLGSASGYLSGTTITTHDYVITRGP